MVRSAQHLGQEPGPGLPNEVCPDIDHDGDGLLESEGDCDDYRADVYPGAQEVWYDGVDQPCDGPNDFDRDGDGFNAADCGWNDCDDGDSRINPSVSEHCDGVDNDCDGQIDDSSAANASTFYADADGDSFGNPDQSERACERPSGYVSDNSDCNDSDSRVNPDAEEVCGDGRDSDCQASPECGVGGTLDLAEGGAALLAGESAGDNAGAALAFAGDVDGDGRPELIIGGPSRDGSVGRAWLVSGADALGGGSLESFAEAWLVGASAGDTGGRAVAGVGDVNGDGFDDVLVGAPTSDRSDTDAGAAWLLLGPLTGGYEAADAALLGARAGERTGFALTGAGDVDGDGTDDFLVGAPLDSKSGPSTGEVYLVTGPGSGGGNLALDGAAAMTGEAAGDEAGWSAAIVGDVDGDGFDDVAVGAHLSNRGGADAGAAYLLHGPLSGTRALADADAELLGEEAGDNAGRALAAGGDVDGDGLADVWIGAFRNDRGGSQAGASYLMLGSALSGLVDLSDANALIVGAAGDLTGFEIAGGDINGDGPGDVLIGAWGDDGADSGAGAAYVFYGPLHGTLETGGADAEILGADPSDYLGTAVALGDIDGNGTADLLLGAARGDLSAEDAGTAYLLDAGIGE